MFTATISSCFTEIITKFYTGMFNLQIQDFKTYKSEVNYKYL
jgi:hypothetical protein